MKFRHVFIIFGVIVFAAVAPLAVRYAIVEARLPQYRWDESSPPTLIINGNRYRQGSALFQPIAMEKTPFGVVIGRCGREGNKEYLYWVDEPDGDWISSKSKTSNFHFRRSDAVDPEPEDVTVCGIRVPSEMRLTVHPRMKILLQGYEETKDFANFILNSDNAFADTDMFTDMLFSSTSLGPLQLLCEEYPRMAFEYSMHRDGNGTIFLIGFGKTIELNDEYSAFIAENLAPSLLNRSPLTMPPRQTEPQYADLPQYKLDVEQKTLLIDGLEYGNGGFFFKPIEKAESPFGMLVGRPFSFFDEYLYWVDEPGGKWITSMVSSAEHHFRRADIVDPGLEDVTICDIRVRKNGWPTDAPPFTASVLRSSEEIMDFVEFILSHEEDLANNELAQEILGHGDHAGLLHLLCEEYPRMAFEYDIFRSSDGAIVLLGSGRTVVINDHYTTLIKEALSQ